MDAGAPTTTERRLLAGLLVGGADVKYHIAGEVDASAFTDVALGTLYRLIMEVPPLHDEKSRRRLFDDLTEHYRRYTETMAEAREVARHIISGLIDECDTASPNELRTMAQEIAAAAKWRESADIRLGIGMALMDGEKPYADLARELEEEGYTRQMINAALKGGHTGGEKGKAKWLDMRTEGSVLSGGSRRSSTNRPTEGKKGRDDGSRPGDVDSAVPKGGNQAEEGRRRNQLRLR